MPACRFASSHRRRASVFGEAARAEQRAAPSAAGAARHGGHDTARHGTARRGVARGHGEVVRTSPRDGRSRLLAAHASLGPHGLRPNNLLELRCCTFHVLDALPRASACLPACLLTVSVTPAPRTGLTSSSHDARWARRPVQAAKTLGAFRLPDSLNKVRELRAYLTPPIDCSPNGVIHR